MADVSMQQNVELQTLLLALGRGVDSFQVSVTNYGAMTIGENGEAIFHSAPSETLIECGETARPKLLDARRKQNKCCQFTAKAALAEKVKDHCRRRRELKNG